MARMNKLISNPEDLYKFRSNYLSVSSLISPKGNSRSLINLPTGLGKTFTIDNISTDPSVLNSYDKIVILCDRHSALKERILVKNRDRRDDVLVLRPRPHQLCGNLNDRWESFEENGCFGLAKEILCSECKEKKHCEWLKQLSPEVLARSKVILGVHDYLFIYPDLLINLASYGKNDRILLIIDESRLLELQWKTKIPIKNLQQTISIIDQFLLERISSSCKNALRKLHRCIIHYLNRDSLSRCPSLGRITKDLAIKIQEAGYERWGRNYHYIVPALRELTIFKEKWYCSDGSIGYIRHPVLNGCDYLVMAAYLPLTLARAKLRDPDLQELYPGIRSKHEGTKIFNIAIKAGARRNFPENADRVLYFYAELVARNIQRGERTLLISKKCFLEPCQDKMHRFLEEILGHHVDIWSEGNNIVDLGSPNAVAIIHYGTTSVNLFEHFQHAYCLNSYNINDKILYDALDDMLPGGIISKVSIDYSPVTGMRAVDVVTTSPLKREIRTLAEDCYKHLENSVVWNTVGRVRERIHPRTVILMQMTDPGPEVDHTFYSLGETREHFDVPTRHTSLLRKRHDRIAELHNAGASPGKIASRLGYDRRTVQRHLNRR
jgi:hypothetical protein